MTQQISKIIPKKPAIPEFGMLVVTTDGMICLNPSMGVKYTRAAIGERLCKVADKHGAYGIMDVPKFLKSWSLLEKIITVDIENKDTLIINYKGGHMKFPVQCDLSDQIPHFNVDWKDHGEIRKSGKGIPINSLWQEVADLTTKEGEALWGSVLGVYNMGKRISTFDYGVYVVGPEAKEETAKFFCPRDVLDLGLRNLEFAVPEEDSLFLVGEKHQYFCTATPDYTTLESLYSIQDVCDKGKVRPVTLDFTSNLWKRAKLSGSVTVIFRVSKGQMLIEHPGWREVFGTTDAPDRTFNLRLSLLERWASKTFKWGLVIDEAENAWYITGKTRGGMDFYAMLTESNVVFDGEDDTPLDELASADEAMPDVTDLGEGESLFGGEEAGSTPAEAPADAPAPAETAPESDLADPGDSKA